MKQSSTTYFTVLALLIFTGMVLLAFSSCDNNNEDNCNNLICQNGGICEDGACNCPTGFGGDNCEILLNCEVLAPLCPPNANCNMVDGLPVCQCQTCYEGDSCTQLIRKRYTGIDDTGLFYNAIDQWITLGDSIAYTVKLSPRDACNEFYIENFAGFDTPSINIRCVITSPTTFIIPDQGTFCCDVDVRNWATEQCSIDTVLHKITIPYIVIYQDYTSDSCKAVLTIQ